MSNPAQTECPASRPQSTLLGTNAAHFRIRPSSQLVPKYLDRPESHVDPDISYDRSSAQTPPTTPVRSITPDSFPGLSVVDDDEFPESNNDDPQSLQESFTERQSHMTTTDSDGDFTLPIQQNLPIQRNRSDDRNPNWPFSQSNVSQSNVIDTAVSPTAPSHKKTEVRSRNSIMNPGTRPDEDAQNNTVRSTRSKKSRRFSLLCCKPGVESDEDSRSPIPLSDFQEAPATYLSTGQTDIPNVKSHRMKKFRR